MRLKQLAVAPVEHEPPHLASFGSPMVMPGPGRYFFALPATCWS
ncbi:hypothetical protein [Actinomyces ruminis]|nr:hypothetical protein [Actinomyces ruminis]